MRTLELGTGNLASDLIPRTHAHLSKARVFFPFTAPDKRLVQWTQFVPQDKPFFANTSWWELLEAADQDAADYQPSSGELDERAADGFRELIGDLTLTALVWEGYWGNHHLTSDYRATTAANSTERYVSRSFTAADVVVGERLPEFAWDDAGTLAWGGPLYADSLVVAADPEHYRRIFAPGLLVAAGVRDDDVMPPNSGD